MHEAFAQWLREKLDEHESPWMDAEPSIAGRKEACRWALALIDGGPAAEDLLTAVRAKAAEYERSYRSDGEGQVYAAAASSALEAAAKELLRALVEGPRRRLTWSLGDWDERRTEIEETLRWFEESMGRPVFAGKPDELRRELHGIEADLTRAVRLMIWEREHALVVATITTHDAGSLTVLELEVL